MSRGIAWAWVAITTTVSVLAADSGDISKNETAAAAACKAFAEAEEIYYRTDYDGDGVLEYAQTLKGGKDGVKVDGSSMDFSKLPQPSEQESKTIEALLKDLGNDAAAVREKATTDLVAMGAKAVARVNAEKSKGKDVEVQERCASICTAYVDTVTPLIVDSRYGLLRDPEHEIAFVDKSFADAECPLGSDPRTITPKAGYLFRVLTRQGKNALGGSRNYFVRGNMTLGYALLAFPKEYGKSGRKCFMINNNGTIFERDFGDAEKTAAFVEKCVEFNPDRTWRVSD